MNIIIKMCITAIVIAFTVVFIHGSVTFVKAVKAEIKKFSDIVVENDGDVEESVKQYAEQNKAAQEQAA